MKKVTIVLKWNNYGEDVDIYKVFLNMETAKEYMNKKYILIKKDFWRDCGEKPCNLSADGRDCENDWFSIAEHDVENDHDCRCGPCSSEGAT